MSENSAFERVLHHLRKIDPAQTYEGLGADIRSLDGLERGAILAEMWGAGRFGQSRTSHFAPEISQIEMGPYGEPPIRLLFTPTSSIRALSGIANSQDPTGTLGDFRPRLVAKVICGTQGALPAEAIEHVQNLLGAITASSLEIAIVAARAVNDFEALQEILNAIAARNDGAIAFEEYEIVAKLGGLPQVLSALAEINPECESMFAAYDPVLADVPAWRTFAEKAVSTTLDRIRDVAKKRTQYKADKLMTVAEATSVARAMTLALEERAPWGIENLNELWFGAALAPDLKAKTAPSQSLAIQLGHAVVAQPQPEAVQILHKVAKDVRHAGVKKKLERAAKAASRSLAQHPERVLDLLSTNADTPDAVAPEFKKLVKPALEGLLSRLWWLDASVWTQQILEKTVWPLAKGLIWDVADKSGDFSALPHRSGSTIMWYLSNGGTRECKAEQRMRLWHPAEASDADRAEWQRQLVATGLVQPFAQAFREIYRVAPSECASQSTELLAGYDVAQVPLFGVARRTGWRGAGHDRLVLHFAGYTFEFQCGVRTWPGAGGEGTTGSFRIVGSQMRFENMPARISSEAMRMADLLIATGNAGLEDILKSDPDNGRERQSLSVRKLLLKLVCPEAKFEGRWLLLGEQCRIHVGTGRLIQNGASIDLATRPKAQSTLRGVDPVMDKIQAAIGRYALA
jgi:hypothetical protein